MEHHNIMKFLKKNYTLGHVKAKSRKTTKISKNIVSRKSDIAIRT